MAKLIQYRKNCIGCGICQEMQPEVWRMSKKDGRAVLLQAVVKKELYLLSIHPSQIEISQQVIEACPANCIKLA